MNQKTTFAIAIALVGGVGLAVASPWNPKVTALDPMPIVTSQKAKNLKSRADMESKTSNLRMDVAGIKHIKVSVQVGEVDVVTRNSSSFEAEIIKGVSKPVSEKEQQWLDNPWLKARRDGDTLVVYEDKSLKPDIFKNSDSKKNNRNIDFTLKLQIPAGLNADVSIDAGTAAVEGDFRSFKSHISAGELKLDHFEVSDFLKVDLQAGEVNAKLGHVPSSDSEIKVAVGEVNLDMKGNANVDAKVSIGSISVKGESGDHQKGLGSKQQLQLGSGGTKFTVNVEAGNINFGSGKTIKREKAEKDELDDVDVDLSALDKIDIDKEISKALKDVDFDMKDMKLDQIDETSIQKEVADALKEAQIEMKSHQVDSKSIQAEIQRAMKEAQVEIDRAMKDADRELAQAIKEIDKELKENEASDSEYKSVIRNALNTAKASIKASMQSAKKSMEAAKKATKKKA